MKHFIWHKGPPPEIGWWPASYSRDPYCLRWWNGNVWSQEARPLDTAEQAAAQAKFECLCSDDMEWTERWWLK